jgi:hypothetical protein
LPAPGCRRSTGGHGRCGPTGAPADRVADLPGGSPGRAKRLNA